MYKVYVNGVPFYMGTPESTADLAFYNAKDVFASPWLGKRKLIKQYLDMLDKRRDVRAVLLYSDQPEQIWDAFCSCFKILEAAGGYVLNTEQKLLVFFRRDSWDMPKGKIDPGETPEQAAVREVQEETGLVNLTLGPLLMHTWHTYTQKGERILKKTWWYHMTTTDTVVTPQYEEDIEQIEWVSPADWLATKPVLYDSVKEVIVKGME